VSNPILRIQLLRKLWVHLTPREMYGISPPDKIQRSGRALGDVRRNELTHLLNIEKQLHEKRRDLGVQNKEGVAFNESKENTKDVAFSQFIDFQDVDSEKSMQLPEIERMLVNAEELSRYEALERLLRLQKLYLLTERIILGIDLNEIDKGPLDRRWFNRWKLNACEISNGALQQLWARILVRELRNSGSSSLRALEFLSAFSLEDAESLNRLASWTIGDFVYRSALQALAGHYDSEMFEKLEEQGVVRGVFGKVLSKTLRSDSDHGFHADLTVADKSLRITSVQPRNELHVPAYMLTSVGRELMALVAPSVDQDYLNLVIQDLHARGMAVEVSENDADPSALQVC